MSSSNSSSFQPIVSTSLPTQWGVFQLFAFQPKPEDSCYLALKLGCNHAISKQTPLLRIHSECLTGDSLFSLRCDCRLQLEESFRRIAEAGSGLLIYERMEGRGIGLLNKLRAYALQDCGLDTAEANLALGLPIDQRDYQVSIQILNYFNIRTVRLLTNNPNKVAAISKAGIQVSEQCSLVTPACSHNAHYLKTKLQKLGHKQLDAAFNRFESI